MKKNIVIVMFVTFISRFIGFGREVALSYFFGTSNVTDSYLVSITISAIIIEFIGVGISTAYIPILSNIITRFDNEESSKFTSNLLSILIILFSVLLIIGLLFTRQLVQTVAKGFDDATIILTIQFTRIILFGMFFTIINFIFEGFLQLKNNFIIPALQGIPLNLMIIFSIFLASKFNVFFLAYGYLFGKFIQFILFIPFLYKKQFKFSFYVNFKDENISKLIKMSIPLIFSLSVTQVNIIIDRMIASSFVVGSISALNYANVLLSAINGTFVATITTVIYPTLSNHANKNDFDSLKYILRKTINTIIIFILPIMIFIMHYNAEIIFLIFYRGAFEKKSLYLTSIALFYYSLGILGVSLREIILKTFYSLKETKIPSLNSVISLLINIFLNLILSFYLGLFGLALATSTSNIVSCVLLMKNLKHKIGNFGFVKYYYYLIKLLLSTLVSLAISHFAFINLKLYMSQNFSFVIASIFFIVGYIMLLFFFKINEITEMYIGIKLILQNKKAILVNNN